METEKEFELATKYVQEKLAKIKQPTQEQQLQFYGLYKVATIGKCTISKPNFWNMVEKAKWTAWKEQENLTKEEAMFDYIKLVTSLSPNWNETSSTNSPSDEEEEKEKKTPIHSHGDEYYSGTVFSRFAVEEEEENEEKDEEETICTFASKGSLEKLKEFVDKGNVDINFVDSEGRSAIHYACDRGSFDIVQYLISKGANVNLKSKDEEEQTALHYAITCEFDSIIELLVKNGADKTIANAEGETPIDIASKEIITKYLS